jgi:uncharacterized phiE125 gp8 family phage protein
MLNPAELVAANTEVVADPQMTVAALSAPVVALAAPALDVAEPITLARAKAHLKVVDPDEDDYISSLIVTAREMAEGRLNRTIVQRRRVAYFRAWGMTPPPGYAWVGNGYPLHLLKPPVISVDNVGYIDASGAEVMLDATAFYMPPVADDEMPRVELQSTLVPFLTTNRRDAVRVYYTAGYPVGEVPTPIIQWMLLAIGTMYANRENEVVGATVAPLPDNFSRYLLQPYMVYE